jgi:hypothetical protein
MYLNLNLVVLSLLEAVTRVIYDRWKVLVLHFGGRKDNSLALEDLVTKKRHKLSKQLCSYKNGENNAAL